MNTSGYQNGHTTFIVLNWLISVLNEQKWLPKRPPHNYIVLNWLICVSLMNRSGYQNGHTIIILC